MSKYNQLYLPITGLRTVLSAAILMLSVPACQTPDGVAPIQLSDPVTASQASLVSVQPTGASTAEVIVKSIRQEPTAWTLSVDEQATNGVSLTTGDTQTLADFSLTTLRLNGLSVGQTYQLRLRFQFADQDSLTALRAYRHQVISSPHWTRLAHASFSGGDYTAYPVAVDGICGTNPMNGCGNPSTGAYVGNRLQLLRYPAPTKTTMETRIYDRTTDSWPYYPVMDGRSSRHGMIQYNLFFDGVDRYQFSGLGYITDERAPSKTYYYRSMSAILVNTGSAVFPLYGGEDGEVAFFTTDDEAYFLTQGGSPAKGRIHADFTQTVRSPLPEPLGTLATFSIRNVGYVVNQRSGEPIRLWAYQPQTDSWIRKADFPGPARRRGIGFALARKGYFGLGLAPDGQGLRDVWQYDPISNQWQPIADYPGQGNQLAAVFSAPDGYKPERAYVGWGYESQRLSTGFTRLVGCTDWWELTL